jgi:aminoglycoside phosphotransferase
VIDDKFGARSVGAYSSAVSNNDRLQTSLVLGDPEGLLRPYLVRWSSVGPVDAMMLVDPALGVVRQEVISLGLSGARVLRMFDADGPVAVIKMVDDTVSHLVDDLEAETVRLEWLAGLGVPVPQVLGHGRVDTTHWLAMRALPGHPASDPWPAGERDGVVDLLAHAARELHATAVGEARFYRSLSSVLGQVRSRVESGLVARSWAIAGKQGPPPADVLAELEQMAHDLGDGRLVVTHGDFCLPNVLISASDVAGFIDVGRAGLADAHSDVADMVRSLRSHMNPQFGPTAAERFLDVYGRDGVDPVRLRMHDILESFFWPVPGTPAAGA